MRALVECAREQDVRDALASGRWPDRCDEDLRAHVAACDVCQDTVVVVAALMDGWDETWTEIRVPSSGAAWWRAQMRARQEAARSAARPLGVAQSVAGVAALALAVALFGAAFSWIGVSAASMLGAVSLEFPRLSLSDAALLARGWWAAGIVAALFVLAPVALYLALLED